MKQRGSVFVVDDHPDIVEVVTDILGGEGYAVDTALDACSGLNRILGGLRPDVVLLDCFMPRMNARGFLDGLERAAIDVPVLLFTASPKVPAELAQRAVGVIKKPCGIDRLLGAIESARAPEHRSRARRPELRFPSLAKCGWLPAHGVGASAMAMARMATAGT